MLAEDPKFREALEVVKRWMAAGSPERQPGQGDPVESADISLVREEAPAGTASLESGRSGPVFAASALESTAPESPERQIGERRMSTRSVAADAPPREERVELSVGTIHLTVEEPAGGAVAKPAPGGGAGPGASGSTAARRSASADSLHRDFLRGW